MNYKKMAEKNRIDRQIDETDLEIIRILQANAKTPFLEIARRLNLSGATIHERVRALQESGIITGFHAHVNLKKMGYGVLAVVEVVLDHPGIDTDSLRNSLGDIREVSAAYNLTGDTDLLIFVYAKDIDELRELLTQKIQNLPGVSRLSTSVVLDAPVDRHGPYL